VKVSQIGFFYFLAMIREATPKPGPNGGDPGTLLRTSVVEVSVCFLQSQPGMEMIMYVVSPEVDDLNQLW
jgi:hypothetical protein